MNELLLPLSYFRLSILCRSHVFQSRVLSVHSQLARAVELAVHVEKQMLYFPG